MVRISASRVWSIVSAAFVLGACTVTVYDKPGAKPVARPAAPRPAQPAVAMRPAFGKQPATRTVPPPPPLRRGATPTLTPGTPAPASQVAPLVSSPTLFGNGTSGAFRGLAYVLTPGTRRIPELSQMTPFATVLTDSFQIRPQPFTGGFPGALMQEDWFAIRYEGSFNVPADGSYMFKLLADDGAALAIDGVALLDNQPGGQGSQLPQGFVGQATASLKAGPHRLRLDYFQAEKGNVSLELLMDPAKLGSQAATPLVGIHAAGTAK